MPASGEGSGSIRKTEVVQRGSVEPWGWQGHEAAGQEPLSGKYPRGARGRGDKAGHFGVFLWGGKRYLYKTNPRIAGCGVT